MGLPVFSVILWSAGHGVLSFNVVLRVRDAVLLKQRLFTVWDARPSNGRRFIVSK